MAVNDPSVATDLGALLRESLSDDVDLTAKNTASIPVQLATAPIGFTPPAGAVRPSYASVHPSGPPSGIRSVGLTGAAPYDEASQPLQMASQPLTMPAPGASTMPAMPTPLSMRSSVPVARPKSNVGLIVGVFLGVLILAGAAGGGFAWYHAKHVVAPAAVATTTPVVPATPVVAPPPK